MEALAALAGQGGKALAADLAQLPELYSAWISVQQGPIGALPGRRRDTGERIVTGMRMAEARIRAGIGIVEGDARARLAFRIMNEAVARAARRRYAIANRTSDSNGGLAIDPSAEKPPRWRPFQLAFILLNLGGLVDKTHPNREIVFTSDAAARAGRVRRGAPRRRGERLSDVVRLRSRNRAGGWKGVPSPAPSEVVGARPGGRSSALRAGKRPESRCHAHPVRRRLREGSFAGHRLAPGRA
jgi:hypothetical protein